MKPYKLTDEQRKQLMGKIVPIPDNQRLPHDKGRRVYALDCGVCGFPAARRIYVCPQCGSCQACGALNPVGQVSGACLVCGNGYDAPQPPIGNISTAVSHDTPNPNGRHDVAVSGHTNALQPGTLHVTNMNQ